MLKLIQLISSQFVQDLDYFLNIISDEVFTNGSPVPPVPITKKKLVYRIPPEIVSVTALPPNEYDVRLLYLA